MEIVLVDVSKNKKRGLCCSQGRVPRSWQGREGLLLVAG